MRFLARNLFTYRLTHSLSKDSNFRVTGCSRTANGTTSLRIDTKSGRSRLIREAEEIDNENSARYVIYLSLRGEFEVSQFGRTVTCQPGSMLMLSGTEELVHTKFGDNDTVAFLLPAEFVDQRLANARDKCVQLVGSRDGLGRLAFHSLALFHEDASRMTDTEFQVASSLVGDLALLALGGSNDASSHPPSIRSAHLARVKRVIRKRLGDLDLSLGDIAEDCGISLSYMHNLFREDDLSAWEFLRNERLQRARQLLTTAVSSETTVTDIAFACGFANMSQFSTAFKRAFSASPREVLRNRNRAQS